jgi:arsenate reductase (glutaredoxin)
MAPNPAVPPAAPRVQIFGLEKDQATRAAIRFFKERRAEVHLVDLRRKPISPGELRRFVQKLGAEALLDTAGRTYREAGLGYLAMDEDGIVARLLADSRLLRLPLVRYGEAVTAGPADATWQSWFTPARAAPPT